MQKVNFAIGLEPKQAIEFLRQKKLLASKVFKQELFDSALGRATTISKLTSLEMTKDIYESMEKARQEGKSFNEWKKTLTAEFERKGWVYGHDKAISRGIDGKLLADPKTGEHFGTPRRLNTIYRTNMQAAYSAARYQRYMDNVDNRPYWQYSAVGDQRTRPAHQALNGKIYRYDDPFWATFYPPNGFNCRCTVIALNDRDLKRKGIDEISSSEPFLVKAKRPKDKLGNQEETIGFKLADGTVRLADKGFDYNVGQFHLAHLGKLILDKGVNAPPRLASIAINHTFNNSQLMQDVVEQFRATLTKATQEIIAGKAFAQGKVFNVGALLPDVVSALERKNINLNSAIISIDDNVLYHSLRDDKANRKNGDKRLPNSFWFELPKHLLNPKAVVRDLTSRDPKIRESTLLYVYELEEIGKVAIRLNYYDKKEKVVTNAIRSGETVLDVRTLRDKNKFELIWGEL